MDWATPVGALLACTVAVAVSSVELLIRYAPRNLREIFFCRHYVGFAALNAIFCLAVFLVLPELTEHVRFGDTSIDLLQRPYMRGLFAGFGYLVIARSSIMDFTQKGQTVGVGFDYLYSTCSAYLLRHHNSRIVSRLRQEFTALYSKKNYKNPVAYLNAFEVVVQGQPSEIRESAHNEIANSLRGKPSKLVACQGIYLVLRDLMSDSVVVEQAIAQAEGEVPGDQMAEEHYLKLTQQT